MQLLRCRLKIPANFEGMRFWGGKNASYSGKIWNQEMHATPTSNTPQTFIDAKMMK